MFARLLAFIRTYAFALVAALAIGASSAWLLLHHPIVGIADNRDFWRVMQPSGVAYCDTLEETVFKFIQERLGFAPPREVNYLTSELLFTKLAVFIQRYVIGGARFSLRLFGACHLPFYVAAIALFVAAQRRRSWPALLVFAALTVLVFSDVKLVAHFNSFYSESASLIFGVFTVAFAMWACDPSEEPGARWLNYVAFIAATIAFAVAKSQNLAFLFVLAPLAYALFPSASPQSLVVRGRRRLAALLVAVALVAIVPWALTSNAYDATRGVNVRVHLEEELLPHSPTPNRDRRELGIRGHDYSAVSLGSLARFYAHHPLRWWQLASRAMREAFSYIAYGNYDRSVGKPPFTNTTQFSTWSELNHRYAPRWLPLDIVFVWLLAIAWLRRVVSAAALADRRRALVSLALLAGAVGQFIVTITFEANGNAKHLFIFNVVVWIVVIFALTDVVDALVIRRRLAKST
ncbi:MAG TPA: hypothetical protein VIA18_20755 [Polyangia bacterium]|nr:hypothetical protein [Polyangia bacterium]